MGKNKEKILTAKELGDNIRERYERYIHIFKEGSSDPTWTDGVNINLVRNHIIYEKSRVEEILKDNYIAYPDEYFYPNPIELPDDFVAVDRKAPILACFQKTGSDVVPARRYGFTNLSQVFLFDWKEALN